jgi:hypothetical protein
MYCQGGALIIALDFKTYFGESGTIQGFNSSFLQELKKATTANKKSQQFFFMTLILFVVLSSKNVELSLALYILY